MAESQKSEDGVEENVDSLGNSTASVVNNVTDVVEVVIDSLTDVALSVFDGSTQHGGSNGKGSNNTSKLHILMRYIPATRTIYIVFLISLLFVKHEMHMSLLFSLEKVEALVMQNTS